MSGPAAGSFALLCRILEGAFDPAAARRALPALPARVDWRALIGLSGTNLVTPLMGLALERCGWAEELEPELRGYFRAMTEAARERNAMLRRDLLRIAGATERAGIPLMPLKGAIRLVDGLYEDDGWRFMHDLDLLVPADRLEETRRLLEGLGWRPMSDDPCHLGLHLPPMIHPDSDSVLELHGRAVPAWLEALLPAAALFARARPFRVEDVTLQLPDATDQLVHLVVHGQLMHGHLYTGRLLLRDLVELVRLVDRSGPAALDAMMRRLQRQGHRLAGELALTTARATLPRAAAALPEGGTLARLLARKAVLQQRFPFLMTVLAPAGAVLRERRAQAPGAGLLRQLARADYRRELRRQWQAFRRKTSW